MSSDWIEHDGGDCPGIVFMASKVGLKFRNGKIRESVTDADLYVWDHTGHAGDIVAYRIETAAEPQKEPQPEKMSSEWIEHGGNFYPDAVRKAKRNKDLIVLKFRDSSEDPTHNPFLHRWTHTGASDDIVAYRIEQTAGEPLQEPPPVRPLGPIPDGWRALEPEDMVERFDVIWDAEKRKGAPVSMWGYPFKNDNGTGLVIIRQLPNGYHRGCGSVDVGVDR